MAFTRDWLPVVARLPDTYGWAVGGFSGNGMSLGFLFGWMPADPPLSICSPDRFSGATA
jgi:hypothetical protein